MCTDDCKVFPRMRVLRTCVLQQKLWLWNNQKHILFFRSSAGGIPYIPDASFMAVYCNLNTIQSLSFSLYLILFSHDHYSQSLGFSGPEFRTRKELSELYRKSLITLCSKLWPERSQQGSICGSDWPRGHIPDQEI